MNIRLVLFSLFIVMIVSDLNGQTNKLAQTPPMGWNSWNWHGKKNINEQLIKETIDAFVEKGLKKAGYEYVVIDGGWRARNLGPNGELLVHKEKFPNGIKPLADYAHSKGLKLGIHTVPGSHDCGGDKVGGFGNEEVQVKQFVEWGIDFVKLDKCKLADGWNEELLKETYVKWRKLLDESGREILLSISAYEYRDWYPEVGHMARTTFDISSIKFRGANFNETKQGVMAIAIENNKAAKFAGPGYWNDADMLVTGGQGLTVEEDKAHFALWCIMSAPLMLGNDPRVSKDEEIKLITNERCIAINQDNSGQGERIFFDENRDVWVKTLTNGKTAVLLINRSDEETLEVSVDLNKISGGKKVRITDVFSGKKLGKYKSSFGELLKPHTCKFIVVAK